MSVRSCSFSIMASSLTSLYQWHGNQIPDPRSDYDGPGDGMHGGGDDDDLVAVVGGRSSSNE